MVDILGPSGQPIQPNPFQQSQQNLSGNVAINTSQAQKAMEDFQHVLDNMMKGFGGTWSKVTNDRLAAEERFYRAVGDKATARQKELEQYSKDAINRINEETKAKINALNDEYRTYKELDDRRTDIVSKGTRDRENIQGMAEKKLAKERGFLGIGGYIRGKAGAISDLIGGGEIGGLVTGAANVLTNPYALAIGSLLEMANTAAAFTKTGAQLAGAGFKLGTPGGTGLNFATDLFNQTMLGPFGRLGQALSASQQREIIGTMAGSRTMIDQARATGGFGAIAGNLGLFANILPDASKEMELFTDATKNLGMSQKDISNTFISSRVNSERVKITQLDAIQTQMEMQKALRNITNDGLVAVTVLSNVGGFLKSMGTTSETERLRITSGIAQAGANLTLPQIAGMFAFTHGGRIPNPEQVFGENGLLKHGGVFGLMGGFLQQIGNQFKDPTQRMFAADQLRQQFMPGLRLQDVPKFFDIASAMQQPGANMANLTKQFQALEHRTPQAVMAEGIETLSNIVGPIQRMENVFTNFWTMVDARINKIVAEFHPGHVLMRAENWVSKNILHRPSGQSGR